MRTRSRIRRRRQSPPSLDNGLTPRSSLAFHPLQGLLDLVRDGRQALVADLENQGVLGETLVICMGAEPASHRFGFLTVYTVGTSRITFVPGIFTDW